MENDLIRADMVEATEFPDLSTRYHVYAVPKTVINENAFIEGSAPEGQLIEAIVNALEENTRKSES